MTMLPFIHKSINHTPIPDRIAQTYYINHYLQICSLMGKKRNILTRSYSEQPYCEQEGDHKVVIYGLWSQQFIVTEGDNILEVTERLFMVKGFHSSMWLKATTVERLQQRKLLATPLTSVSSYCSCCSCCATGGF